VFLPTQATAQQSQFVALYSFNRLPYAIARAVITASKLNENQTNL
jgi:hypothetical protein